MLDGEVVSRPIINFVENPGGIDGRTGAQISGSFSIQESQDLAENLRIGALPIDLNLISQSTVSATLGQEALDQGLKAGIVGLILVLLFLIAYYRFLGVVAAVGLGVYALFFLALIKLIPITLTLPGIAGLVLTIGVAADSNIVIFERIKEEIREGRSTASAIAAGYRKGIATIIDANVITLITAFILFVLATAGVKGFAFVLGVGTIVSLLTAVVFTQAVLGVLGKTRVLRSPRFLGASDEQRVRWHFDFTGMSKWFFSFSGVILAVGAISFATAQLNLGIDFESGTRVNVSLAEPATVEEVRTTLSDAGIEGAGSAAIQEVENPEFGENVLQIETDLPPDQVGEAQTALDEAYGLEGGDDGFQSTSIGPTFGEQVAKNAAYAIIFSLFVISAYIAWRFEAKYAVPVIIAMLHDILITGAVYSLVGRRGLERDRRRVPDDPRVLALRHRDRLRPNTRERAEDAARGVLADRQPLDERGPHPVADHGSFDRVPDRMPAHLRRRHAQVVRAGDDDRRRLGYVLLDLHRVARSHRVEGARALIPLPPRAAPGGDGLRARLPGGERRRQGRRRGPRGPRRHRGRAAREARGRCLPRRRRRRCGAAQTGDGSGDGAAAQDDDLVAAETGQERRQAKQQRRKRQQRRRAKHGRNR